MLEKGFAESIPATWEFGSQSLAKLLELLISGDIMNLRKEGSSIDGFLQKLKYLADRLQKSTSRTFITDEIIQSLQRCSNQDIPILADGNIWIIKPIGLSCGDNIRVCLGLQQALQLFMEFEGRCIVQKYIENPLLLRHNTFKFDLRQWVLIKRLSPLIVYGFSEFYVRLSSRPFSLSLDELENPLVHLTNFAIQRQALVGESDIESPLMMTETDFKLEIESRFSPEAYTALKERIKLICLQGIESGVANLQNNEGSFEWLGLDLMVDSDLKVSLIEMNTSPDISYSTPVTTQLVKAALSTIYPVICEDPLSTDSCPLCLTNSLHWCCWANLSMEGAKKTSPASFTNYDVYWKKARRPPYLETVQTMIELLREFNVERVSIDEESEDEI